MASSGLGFVPKQENRFTWVRRIEQKVSCHSSVFKFSFVKSFGDWFILNLPFSLGLWRCTCKSIFLKAQCKDSLFVYISNVAYFGICWCKQTNKQKDKQPKQNHVIISCGSQATSANRYLHSLYIFFLFVVVMSLTHVLMTIYLMLLLHLLLKGWWLWLLLIILLLLLFSL